MGLFKKPNRKFRQRETKVDSEEEENSNVSEAKDPKLSKLENPNKIKTTKLETKATFSVAAGSSDCPTAEKDDVQVKTARKLLSFHDEEDEQEIFKVKKSNHSRRLAKLLEKERKKKLGTLETTASIDEKHEIKESPPHTEVGNADENSNQPKETWGIVSGKDAEDMDVDSGEESKDSQIDNPFKNVLQSGVIPDAATIYAMKKHRQMAREVGDFVPLEEDEKLEETKSRLVREDDNDRSDDDDDEPSRLSFSVNIGAIERQKVREAFLSVQEGNQEELENDEAAELERWEAEQIRKGVGIAQVAAHQQPQVTEQPLFPYQSGYEEKPFYNRVSSEILQVQPDPSVLPRKKDAASLTTSLIKSRLRERLTSLEEVHRAHERELDNCHCDLVAATDLIEKLENDGPELSKRFSFYQQMRGYVRDLVECLDLKVAHIEVLDQNMMDLQKARSEKLISRRQQDIRDQSDEYSILSSKVLRGSNIDVANDNSICTDETKSRRIAEREGRRMRRRKKREQILSLSKHHDGMSSDDEEPAMEVMRFKNKKDSIVNEAEGIFEDVVEDFGTIEGVKSNFEKWKIGYNVSYDDAYVPLCMPKIFGPFVLMELMDWNPLENNKDFENMHWFEILLFYGCLTSDKDNILGKDPDINLIPRIIEKTLLPKISGFVINVWDPMSTKETQNLVSLISNLLENFPSLNSKSKQMQTFLKEVCSRIYKSLSDDVFIPMYPKELLEKKSQGSSAFFQRQFWSSVKLLCNILSWDGIIAEETLQDMSLSSLLNRYLLMGLRTSIMMKDTFEKCKMIVTSFPKSWFSNLKGSSTITQIKPFAQFLMQFAQALHTCNSKRGLDDDFRDNIKEISQMLISIGSLDEAVILRKQFSVSSGKNM